MLPPQAQDYALSFMARRLAIQMPSVPLPNPSCNELFSSSLSRYIPFIKLVVDKAFPMQHVTMQTLTEVVVLQLRSLASAIETVDESDSDLNIDLEAKQASEYLALINVRCTCHFLLFYNLFRCFRLFCRNLFYLFLVTFLCRPLHIL